MAFVQWCKMQKLRSDGNQRNLIPVTQGHLNFASSFIMGRMLQPLARSLSWKMSPDEHADFCSAILDTLGKRKPRTVSWHSPAQPILLFTDASYEGGRSGIGAVLVDTLGGKPEIFDGEARLVQLEDQRLAAPDRLRISKRPPHSA